MRDFPPYSNRLGYARCGWQARLTAESSAAVNASTRSRIQGRRDEVEPRSAWGGGTPTCGKGKAQRGPGALLSDAMYTMRAMLADSQ